MDLMNFFDWLSDNYQLHEDVELADIAARNKINCCTLGTLQLNELTRYIGTLFIEPIKV